MHDRPGVTRDRLSAEVEWQGRPFMLVDTGGIGLLKGEQGGDDFAQEIVTQVQVALDDVDVILFVVSVHEGIVPMDLEVAGMLREAGKPVLLIINKVDTVGHDKGVDEFSELGFEHMFPVSALHDRGVDTPLGQAVGLLPKPLAKPVERRLEWALKPVFIFRVRLSWLSTKSRMILVGYNRPPESGSA